MKAFLQRFTFILCLFLLPSCLPVTLPTPTVQHTIESSSKLSLIWTLENVYIRQDSFSPMTGAADGKFCFFGNLTNESVSKIICLDALDGKVSWETGGSTSVTAFAVSSEGVFVGSTGIASITRFDLDGNFIWDTSFTGNGVIRIYVVDGEVQVFNHPERLRIFNSKTGDLIRKIDGDTIFIATDTENFIYTYNLILIDPQTKSTKWEAEIKGVLRIRMSPLFTDDAIYVREGETMGRVYAIDRVSGKILWETDDNIISNAAYSPQKEKIYLLTRSGELLEIDKDNGTTSTLVQFSGSPLILNGEMSPIGGYELSYDESTNILFVTLGDSRQLLAFQE